MRRSTFRDRRIPIRTEHSHPGQARGSIRKRANQRQRRTEDAAAAAAEGVSVDQIRCRRATERREILASPPPRIEPPAREEVRLRWYY